MKQGEHKAKKKPSKQTARSVAHDILIKIMIHGRSLATVRSDADELEPRERGHAMELVHGVLRWRWKLEYILNGLLKKPLRSKEQSLQILLLLALFELLELSTPDYAVVNEAVKLSRLGGRSWASGMVNAVLRSFIRDREHCLAQLSSDEALYSHPGWFIDVVQHDWPDHWQSILQANNQRPPFWLRVNRRQYAIEEYRKLLQQQGLESVTHSHAHEALKLAHSLDVKSLPGFEQGSVSVQDAAAQLAAGLLNVEAGQRVLDLCAAPGGKTCHLLEMQPAIKAMVAVELDEQRMLRVRENLDRLQLEAELVVADASNSPSWWDGDYFERILVDAPCSASGVIRRHPDIKSLRREQDLLSLVVLQQQILHQAWQMLSPGGELLYVTCSVLRQENEQQISRLLAAFSDASEQVIDQNWGQACLHGRQLFPGDEDADGFYFARLRKTDTSRNSNLTG